MGELVRFRPAEGLERKNNAPRDQDARILFFTGVRYQRASDPAARRAWATPKRRRRAAWGSWRRRRQAARIGRKPILEILLAIPSVVL